MLCIKLVIYWDTYTEMHDQQNVKKCPKHVLFYSKYNCEKLPHLFGFIIRTDFYLNTSVPSTTKWNNFQASNL